jgi:hypothetical protein
LGGHDSDSIAVGITKVDVMPDHPRFRQVPHRHDELVGDLPHIANAKVKKARRCAILYAVRQHEYKLSASEHGDGMAQIGSARVLVFHAESEPLVPQNGSGYVQDAQHRRQRFSRHDVMVIPKAAGTSLPVSLGLSPHVLAVAANAARRAGHGIASTFG